MCDSSLETKGSNDNRNAIRKTIADPMSWQTRRHLLQAMGDVLDRFCVDMRCLTQDVQLKT